MLFYLTWALDEGTKASTYAAFAKMTPADHAADMGPKVSLVARLHDVGTGEGMAVFESDSAEAIMAWVYKWSPAAQLSITPVVTDAQSRRIINGKDAEPHQPLQPLSYDDADGMVFWMQFKIHRPAIAACFDAFGKMGPAEDANDAGENKMLLRVTSMGTGSGACVVQSKSLEALYVSEGGGRCAWRGEGGRAGRADGTCGREASKQEAVVDGLCPLLLMHSKTKLVCLWVGLCV